MDKIIPIAILVLFIILTASWLFSRPNVTTAAPPSCFRFSSPIATWI